jgi:hypothetical protein
MDGDRLKTLPPLYLITGQGYYLGSPVFKWNGLENYLPVFTFHACSGFFEL